VVNYKTHLSHLNSELEIGETTREAQCPFCLKQNGDFAVTRVEDGLLYKCFRVVCDSKGFVPSNMGKWYFSGTYSTRKNTNLEHYPFESFITKLNEMQVNYLQDKFSLTIEELILNKIKWCTKTERIIYPILSKSGNTKGYVSRYYKELSGKKYDGVKSRTYWVSRSNNYYNVSFPYCEFISSLDNLIVLVEDIVSSIRIARHVPSMALLSNSIPTNAMRFLSGKEVVIVLDNDATAHALKIKQKYSLFFKSCQVIPVDEDPKNMSNENIINNIITKISINLN
jgi:hypothetical protein